MGVFETSLSRGSRGVTQGILGAMQLHGVRASGCHGVARGTAAGGLFVKRGDYSRLGRRYSVSVWSWTGTKYGWVCVV